MLAIFVIATLLLVVAFIGAEPVLVFRLNRYVAISLALSHFAALPSLFDLYRKAERNQPVKDGDVLGAASLVIKPPR